MAGYPQRQLSSRLPQPEQATLRADDDPGDARSDTGDTLDEHTSSAHLCGPGVPLSVARRWTDLAGQQGREPGRARGRAARGGHRSPRVPSETSDQEPLDDGGSCVARQFTAPIHDPSSLQELRAAIAGARSPRARRIAGGVRAGPAPVQGTPGGGRGGRAAPAPDRPAQPPRGPVCRGRLRLPEGPGAGPPQRHSRRGTRSANGPPRDRRALAGPGRGPRGGPRCGQRHLPDLQPRRLTPSDRARARPRSDSPPTWRGGPTTSAYAGC